MPNLSQIQPISGVIIIKIGFVTVSTNADSSKVNLNLFYKISDENALNVANVIYEMHSSKVISQNPSSNYFTWSILKLHLFSINSSF